MPVLRNATDAHVNQNKPKRNHANAKKLVLCDKPEFQRHALIYFSRPFPLGAKIIDAKLRFFQQGDWTGENEILVKRAIEPWKVGKVTWDNMPDHTNTGAKSVTKTGSNRQTEWEFDVTSHMQLVSDGEKWYGWKVQLNSTNDDVKYLHSSQADYNSLKPQLDITYAVAPDAPDTLTPSGGRYVSTSHPVLSFDFDDKGGDDLRAFEVEVGSTGDMVGAWNSGVITSNISSIDLSQTTFPGIAAGASAFWRVKVQDETGEWSAWSDVADFKYAAKGILTITSPAGNVVGDTSPTIIWSLTGVGQRAWRVSLRDAYGDEIYDSGKFTSLDTGWTIPDRDHQGKRIIKYKGSDYTLVLRVWDDIDREDNNSVYIEQRIIQYSPGAANIAPSSPTITDLGREPGFVLTWTRAEAPDKWVIWRDDEKIQVIDDPEDAATGVPGEYRYVDYEARPGRSHAYRIGATVNGEQAESATTVSPVKEKVTGIWLVDGDPDRTVKVQIMDADEGSWEMGEVSEVYVPVGSNRVHVVTQALRGYEGNLSGMLVDTGNKTVEEQEEDMFMLKSTPGKIYSLVLSDVTMPVVINNIVVSPTPMKENVKRVSFDFYQQGNLPFRARQ